MSPHPRTGDDGRRWQRAALAVAFWSFTYAGYRAYYAAGGQVGMVGQAVSSEQFRALNAFGAAIIAFAGLVPLAALRVRSIRPILPTLCWIAAVGCCMHALVDVTLRLFSVTGVHPTELPSSVWLSYDRRAADLQDLLLNEPWFFVEGLLWATLGAALVQPSRRRTWLTAVAVACLLLAAIGVASGLGIIPSFRYG